MKTYVHAAITASILGFVAGGATTSLASEGVGHGIFPDAETSLTDLGSRFLRQGEFLPLQGIAAVDGGMGQLSKVDVSAQLGQPNDPISQPDDSYWLYNISLPLVEAAHGDDHLICQYMVAFDDQERVNASYWRRPLCQTIYNALIETKELTLSADVLFGFDSAEITPAGRSAIRSLAWEIRDNTERPVIRVVGHTDYIGAADYNMALSERRANAVAAELATYDVPLSWMYSEGRGYHEPVVYCDGNVVTEALKSCLAPNRRVNVHTTDRLPQ